MQHILLNIIKLFYKLYYIFFSVLFGLLSSRLLSKNLNTGIKVYKTIIFPIMLYECSHLLREGFSLRVFENRILRRIFGPKRDENGEWKGSKMRNFIVCTVGSNFGSLWFWWAELYIPFQVSFRWGEFWLFLKFLWLLCLCVDFLCPIQQQIIWTKRRDTNG